MIIDAMCRSLGKIETLYRGKDCACCLLIPAYMDSGASAVANRLDVLAHQRHQVVTCGYGRTGQRRGHFSTRQRNTMKTSNAGNA